MAMSIMSFLRAASAIAVLMAAGTAGATVTKTTDINAFLATNNANTEAVADQVNWGLFDDTLHQPHENGSIPTGSMMTTSLGEDVTASASDHNAFVTYVEGGPNWKGTFANGMTILATSANSITLSFGIPLIGIGLHAQTIDSGLYSMTITAYSSLCSDPTGATCTDAAHGLLGSLKNTGNTNTGEGTAPFVGISTNAQNNAASLASLGISFVVITASGTTAAGQTLPPDGFAIDTSLLYHYAKAEPPGPGPAAPEPATLALLGVGLAGLGVARRRRGNGAAH